MYYKPKSHIKSVGLLQLAPIRLTTCYSMKKAKVSSIVKTSEKIQPDPGLNGEKIARSHELKYLGLELNDLNKNNSHLKKRKSLAYTHA